MAQIWTQDITPQLIAQEGENTARMIEGLGATLGQSLAGIADRLEKRKEAEKREQANAKAADTLFKNNPELQKLMGMDEHTYSGLARHERAAAVQSGIASFDFQQKRQKGQMEVDEHTLSQSLKQAQLRQQQEEENNFARFPAFAQRMAETGQDPASIPAPFSNEEFDRRTAPPDFRTLMEAAARTGYRPREGTLDDLTRAIQSGQPKPAVVLPPGFAPQSMTVGGVTYAPPKAEKPVLQDHPGIYDDDINKAVKAIISIKDPVQRELATESRNNIETLKGRPGLLEKLLAGSAPGAAPKADAAPAAGPKLYYDPATGGVSPNKPK